MDNIDQMAEAIKQGIDNNASDAPAMSIDPKTQQVSVVGDPNNIKPTDGAYEIKFTYPADQLSADDKAKMKKSEENEDEYETVVTYHGKRVKPLHRTTIAMALADILTQMGVITTDGSYNTDGLNRTAAQVFLRNIDTIADIAVKTLDIPAGQAQYMSPDSLVEFFIQLMTNEPNVIKESASFLEPSSIKALIGMIEKRTTQPQGTPQN